MAFYFGIEFTTLGTCFMMLLVLNLLLHVASKVGVGSRFVHNWLVGLMTSAAILIVVEASGVWSGHWLDAFLVIIPEEGGDATPIGLLLVVYKLWAAVRLSHIQDWFASWLPDSVFSASAHQLQCAILALQHTEERVEFFLCSTSRFLVLPTLQNLCMDGLDGLESMVQLLVLTAT